MILTTRRPSSTALLNAALVLALCLSGCGKSPATTASGPATEPAPSPTPAGGSPANPAASPPTGPAAPGSTAEVMARFQAAWAATRTLSGHYELWEKSGNDTEIAKVDIWFQKPGHYRLEVADATEALKRGSKSVFDTHTRQISSRPGGPLSLVKIDGTLDDARSKSVRGYTLDQTDYASHVAAMLAGGVQVHLIQGHGPGPTLELLNPPKFHGIEALRETLDPQKMLPVYFEMTEAGKIVHTRRYTKLTVNPSIGSDKFSL